MSRKKGTGTIMNGSSTVAVKMPSKMVEHLKKTCIHMSQQKGDVVTLSEFIRETMMQYCPKDLQQDFFVKETRKTK